MANTETRTIGVRLSNVEESLIERAMQLDKGPGDRGGLSSWMRRIALREAQRIIKEHERETQPPVIYTDKAE